MLARFEELGDGEEAKRLLYVALTRAKEALIVSSRGTRTKDDPAGRPKGALAGIATALDATGVGFAPGTSLYGFGGTTMALVEHVALEADAETADVLVDAQVDSLDADAEEPPAEQEKQSAMQYPADGPFARAESERMRFVPYRPSRQDVFSYSSIAEASHGSSVLDELAERFGVGCEGCSEMPQSIVFEVQERPAAPSAEAAQRFDAYDFEDDDRWAAGTPFVSDSDKATDLGTAFHRLAQLACLTRARHAGRLTCPDEAHIEALVHSCWLGHDAEARLRQALARWFASDVARTAERFAVLSAEVPFFVRIDRIEGAHAGQHPAPVYLEGEIDLLGLSDDGKHAYVVDYKTGGHADEDVQTLMRKHVLQATCYAYALMRQGIEQVDACFVRVEQPRLDELEQPQCVLYRFSACDLGFLEQAIVNQQSLL